LSCLIAGAVSVGTGCGSDSGSETTAGGGSTAAKAGGGSGGAGVAQSRADIKAVSGIPAPPTLPKVDPKAIDAMQGKRIVLVPLSTSVPFQKGMIDAAATAFRELGAKPTVISTSGDFSQIRQAVSQAVPTKPAAIVTVALDPKFLAPQLQQARAAGIKVVAGHQYDREDTIPDYVDAFTPAPFYEAGVLDADYVIANSDGKGHAMIVTSDEQTPAPPTVKRMKERFAERCPGCKVTVVNVPITDWATKMQSAVQSALLKDPTIDWVIPLYDGAVQFVAPAITATGKQNATKIVSFNGSPFVLKHIQDKQIVAADLGENIEQLGYDIADATARSLGGEEGLKDRSVPLRMFDASNVDETGTPPKLGAGFGTAWKDSYTTAWGK
jgi:ribose transport system substrate-binding protein